MNKLVSVIMGIYNCEKYLEEALDCIVNQTYTNWEVIMCDDGSKDNTIAIAQKFVDKHPNKFRLLKNEQNMGLNFTLNKCLHEARGEYIARMDGDDLCVPERFEKQLDFLNTHSEFDIVSSHMTLFDETGEWGVSKSPEYPTKEQVVAGSPICHAPVMIRKECMDAVGGYTINKRMLRVEDVNLWIKLYSKGYRAYNIQEPLYKMRNDKNALQRRKYKYRINSTYVRLLGCKSLKLSFIYYIKTFKPMVIGLVPAKLRHKLQKSKRLYNKLIPYDES